MSGDRTWSPESEAFKCVLRWLIAEGSDFNDNNIVARQFCDKRTTATAQAAVKFIRHPSEEQQRSPPTLASVEFAAGPCLNGVHRIV